MNHICIMMTCCRIHVFNTSGLVVPVQDVSNVSQFQCISFPPKSDLSLLYLTLTGVNFKEVNEENKQNLFGEIYSAIDTLAFTFGNV